MRLPILRTLPALLAIGSIAVVGCQRADRTTPEADGTAATAETARLDDDQVETYVRARFQTDPGIRSRNILVSADDGVVTLRGMVNSEQTRAHLVNTAREVDGVRSVNDELRVGESTTADSREAGARAVGTAGSATAEPLDVTTRIQAEFFQSDDVRASNIEVNASDAGVVTLRGEAESEDVRDEAERIARGIAGVSRVDNRIRLAGEPERAAADRDGPDRPLDPWITAKIQAKYFLDGDVKARSINVDTTEGAVTLRGDVESEAERRQAVALARNTDGVRTVNDELRVQPPAETVEGRDRDQAGERRDDGVVAGIDDAWVTTKIQSRYFLEPDVKGRDIDVDTRRGVVTLKGTVDTDAERRLAESIARDTDGVSRVVNQLRVGSASTER